MGLVQREIKNRFFFGKKVDSYYHKYMQSLYSIQNSNDYLIKRNTALINTINYDLYNKISRGKIKQSFLVRKYILENKLNYIDPYVSFQLEYFSQLNEQKKSELQNLVHKELLVNPITRLLLVFSNITIWQLYQTQELSEFEAYMNNVFKDRTKNGESNTDYSTQNNFSNGVNKDTICGSAGTTLLNYNYFGYINHYLKNSQDKDIEHLSTLFTSSNTNNNSKDSNYNNRNMFITYYSKDFIQQRLNLSSDIEKEVNIFLNNYYQIYYKQNYILNYREASLFMEVFLRHYLMKEISLPTQYEKDNFQLFHYFHSFIFPEKYYMTEQLRSNEQEDDDDAE